MKTTEQKSLVRKEIEGRIAKMTLTERGKENVDVCNTLLAQIPDDAVVCGYMPLPTEIDIRPLLEQLLKRGQEVHLPRYEDGNIVFCRITDLKTLTEGRYNIPEPPKDAQVLEDGKAEIVLVPGRAFDIHGNRLGRGGGGYDKWISKQREANSNTKFLGLAFSRQMIDEVPTEPHDQKVDDVITPKSSGIL